MHGSCVIFVLRFILVNHCDVCFNTLQLRYKSFCYNNVILMTLQLRFSRYICIAYDIFVIIAIEFGSSLWCFSLRHSYIIYLLNVVTRFW